MLRLCQATSQWKHNILEFFFIPHPSLSRLDSRCHRISEVTAASRTHTRAHTLAQGHFCLPHPIHLFQQQDEVLPHLPDNIRRQTKSSPLVLQASPKQRSPPRLAILLCVSADIALWFGRKYKVCLPLFTQSIGNRDTAASRS